ncbi:Hypothetical protein HVR_LOCUS212 [uncultured virus]|nr:Hypothetical protein HVR_LOCUS212 [uncultured virus]
MSVPSQIFVKYGVTESYIDVTAIAMTKCVRDNMLIIPASDYGRAEIFGDPAFGKLKHIVVTKDGKETFYFDNEFIYISVFPGEPVIDTTDKRYWFDRTITDPVAKLSMIHSFLRFTGGNIKDEYPEQLMAATFIEKHNKVLEIGSNIGRNTLTIATILENQENLVTLESDVNTCVALKQNMDLNGYKFHIEPSALSYRKLIQNHWDTIPSDVVLPGYKPVNTITFQELEAKYNIQFDTLVADCEGALYYILLDYSDMLNNIKTVIMENDYRDGNHKAAVDKVLVSKGFKRVYVESGGWGPCFVCFYEAWIKDSLVSRS